ncbi:MAG: hypothetical protein KBT68_03615, partial [bacterium]|nr:hypothetical protein [Candidatus Colisoma equi]
STLVTEKDRLEREIKIYAPYGDFDPALAKKLVDRGIDLGDELPAELPEMRLSKMQEKLARVTNRIAVDTVKLAMSDEKAILRKHPALCERMEFEQAKELMSAKGAVSVVSGWIPETKVSCLTFSARDNGWGFLLRDPAEGEIPPTLIDPPSFVKPVKALFEGLGIAPAYDESDVSVPFMCYFSLFFAMLVGDGAYGVIFLVATLFGWHKLTRFGQVMTPQAVAARSWLVLMTAFSLATIVWGALSNTWFGAQIPWCRDWPTVRWLSGADAPAGHEYDNMMFLCFTIGVSHLMLARLWNGVCKLNDRSCLGEFGWAGIVLFMYILTNSIVGIFDGVPTWAFWMFGVSFLTVFIQAKGMDKGMLFLNAMSVLGDIISYVRLFAVGLASVKVAENFNGMALDLGLPIWIKWLPVVLIMAIGHGLNLAMAGLSVLVHAVRLNTLEFSNHKGVSWAGYAFRPFGRKEFKV